MSSAEVLAAGEPPTPVPAAPSGSRRGLPPLARYLLVRLALVVPMIWVLVTLVFVLLRVIGDPITAAQGGRLTPEQIAERKAEAGLDRPLLVQYWEYLSGLLHGDFGRSLTDRDRLPDVALRLFAIVAYAAPVFFVGLLLKLAFTPFGWPSSGRASTSTLLTLEQVRPRTNILLVDAILWGDPRYVLEVLQYALLPALALGLLTGGVFLRLVRINLLQTMRAEYVTSARARGMAEGRVIRKVAFRNALVPVVTVMGMQVAMLLAGAVLTETTFEWKGIGYALAEYLKARDFLAVQGIVTVIALVVCVASFLIDVIVALVDPRVRF